MKSWKSRKNGKIKMVIAYFIFISLAYFALVIYGTGKDGGSFFENFILGLIMFSLFIIFALIYPPIWIIRKKIVTRLEIDNNNDLIRIEINNKVLKEFQCNAISYSIYKHKYYCILAFHQKLTTKNNNIIHREIFDLIGNVLNISWSIQDVLLIESEIISSNIPKHNVSEKNILDRF